MQPTDETLLTFLEGSMEKGERDELLDALDADPSLSERLRAAAAGLEAMRTLAAASEPGVAEGAPGAPLRVSPWWVVAAAAATLAMAVPVTWWMARASLGDAAATGGRRPGAEAPANPAAAIASGIPQQSEPSYVLVLHGRWPDAGDIAAAEVQRRAREYWGWTSALAREGILMAAGDLRWEPGERLGPAGTVVAVAAEEMQAPQYIVGMYALRANTYEEALEIARRCPHLRYGGSISVRRVGAGFVTAPGMGDW